MQKTQEQFSVTLLVMSDFSVLPGAPRACTDFCDPTAVFRFSNPMGAVSVSEGYSE
ncbi:MAG: hypothetical protein ACWA44_08310 [Thiotrichales bacterium]